VSAKPRTGSKLKTAFYLLMIPVCFLLAINLFWLAFSTTRVEIVERGLADVKIIVGEEVIELGDLRRGETRFMFLPKHGTTTYSISFMQQGYTHTACAVEVNETNNHVEAHLYPERESVCTVTEPLLSEIMVTKFF
jgi:hypothetical protein